MQNLDITQDPPSSVLSASKTPPALSLPMAALLSSHPIPFSLSDLSQANIDLLTQILSQTPTDKNHRKALSTLIKTLPHHLRAPVPHQSKIVNRLSLSINVPACAPLCSLHSPLNAQLIRTIFTAVATEVGIRLNTLASSTCLHPEQKALVQNLRKLQALWLAAETYSKTPSAHPDPSWPYQIDACEACMLARIGASIPTITALRTVILSRKRKYRPEPRLLRWVDGWIGWTGEAESLRVISEDDGAKLKKARRAARRRCARGMGREDHETVRNAAAGDSDDDFEHEIIDHYAALPSSTCLPIEERECFDQPQTETFQDFKSIHQSSRQNIAPHSANSGEIHGGREAEQQAKDYQALLGGQTYVEPRRERRSKSTTWSAFIRP
ncbi:MAG: hypothetical protein M1830_005724 [Pleopsidium flavum]|nr:MAG: hypothetical protein M1830_005724 [Pleopsidium flavum]